MRTGVERAGVETIRTENVRDDCDVVRVYADIPAPLPCAAEV